MMTALSTNIKQLNRLIQPAEPYINNYHEYRNILFAQFTKLFLQVILAHFCGSKHKIRNDWYHQIQVVGYQSASPVQYPVKSRSDRISFTPPSIVFTITFPLKVQQSLIFSWLLQLFRLLGQRRPATYQVFVDVHRRSIAAFTQAASRTDDHVAHVGRGKFDDHWPWSSLRVCTWHAPSEPMTCHYVGAHNGRCDSHCFVHNRQQLAGGIFPQLWSGIPKNSRFVFIEYCSSWSRSASTEDSLASRAAIYSSFLSNRSLSWDSFFS